MKVTVIAHPNSKKPRIEKDMFETLHVYVSAPPLEGKANKAVVEALSSYFGQNKNQIKLVSGAKSKAKTFQIG